ncbi:MAG: ABC transporter permease subunit, partial [Ktedonobacterales bacterium]
MEAAVAFSRVERVRDAGPSFVGIVRGELFKMSRQRFTWVLGLLLVGMICLPYLGNLNDAIRQAPVQAMYLRMGSAFFVLRVYSGIVLILLTARLIGMEYSGGTIRVLLSRGVGRVQLLRAKLLALALVALAVFAAGLLLNGVLTVLNLTLLFGSLDPLTSLQGSFWADAALYGATVLISMGVTILMAAAVTALTRSLAAGLSIGLGWFPADNIGVIFFFLTVRLTGSTFWTLVTGEFLGPNLNVMAGMLMPERARAAGEFAPAAGARARVGSRSGAPGCAAGWCPGRRVAGPAPGRLLRAT